ncbi:UDP-N-acetylmuramoyl-L-alanyl-D-glutamate--2,6-diaminopimelate ligase [Porphyromonas asaccharolytica]|uniref:UDP-N-acetylmuramoyl-L-alanyl-D-glutamate--2, 6-diaminopimelate ligase n=1 Tax=Porphyromonas asaccharolytica TaxID=28123 RepID=UPI00248D5D03|nr:UDP-N-acetylmuramoyl-L-alanyl-D-glutamate--2,6-diaminopimelate ligase [Porphyromonas asaccharolytica]
MNLKPLNNYIVALTEEHLLSQAYTGEVSTEQCLVTSIEQDSRRASEGCIFVALRGVHVDGADYIPKALAAGCRIIVTEHPRPESLSDEVAWLTVTDTAKAIAVLASVYYDRPERQLTIVGVTGTNGKTTTATLCYQLWNWLGMRAALFSTVCIRIGDKEYPATHTTPDALELHRVMRDMVDAGCRYLFMEVSSHALVQQRVYGLPFALALFTNLTRDHLDYHGTMQAYIAAKKLLFDHLTPDAYALVNADDRNGSVMVQNCAAHLHTYAMRSHADYMAQLLGQYVDGSTLLLDNEEVEIKLVGSYNAYNVTAVYGVARLLLPDLDKSLILRGISSLEHVNGRFDLLASPRGYHVVVDYAHTPDALENLLKTVSELNASQVYVVVGAGGDRDMGKRPEMGRIAYNMCDQLYLTSDNPRSEDPQTIIDQMLEGIPQAERDEVYTNVSRRQAITDACAAAQRGDLVVIAGKGHETYQEIEGVRHHFDDKEVVREIFAEEEHA